MAIKTILLIRADTNDADYVTEETDISAPEQEKKVRAVLSVLGPLLKASNGDWPMMDHDWSPVDDDSIDWSVSAGLAKTYPTVSLEDLEYLNDLCPRGEAGIHTIKSIRILKVESEENLL